MVCNLFLRRFPRRDGSEITYIQYYQERFGIKITDLKQPLIVSMPTKQEQRKWGRTDPVYLVSYHYNSVTLFYQSSDRIPRIPLAILKPTKCRFVAFYSIISICDGHIFFFQIPEICNMTGLSDDQRANFKLMAVSHSFF